MCYQLSQPSSPCLTIRRKVFTCCGLELSINYVNLTSRLCPSIPIGFLLNSTDPTGQSKADEFSRNPIRLGSNTIRKIQAEWHWWRTAIIIKWILSTYLDKIKGLIAWESTSAIVPYYPIPPEGEWDLVVVWFHLSYYYYTRSSSSSRKGCKGWSDFTLLLKLSQWNLVGT